MPVPCSPLGPPLSELQSGGGTAGSADADTVAVSFAGTCLREKAAGSGGGDGGGTSGSSGSSCNSCSSGTVNSSSSSSSSSSGSGRGEGRSYSTGGGDSSGRTSGGDSSGRSAEGSESDGGSTDDSYSDDSSARGGGTDGTDGDGSAFHPLDPCRPRWEANLATIPDLQRSPERLVDPPAAFAAARMAVTWTTDERATFLALHWAHGKDWRRVAAGLPSKSIPDVVRHYYDAKVLLGLGTRLTASAGDTPAERAATFARLAAIPLSEARGAVRPGSNRARVGGRWWRLRLSIASHVNRRLPEGGGRGDAPLPPPPDNNASCCVLDSDGEPCFFMRNGELWEILYHIFRYKDEPDPPPDPPGARAFPISLGPYFWVWYKCVRVPPGMVPPPRAAAARPRRPLAHSMGPC
ncbi:hypothetical protein BU14_0459s0021 [Porphyra umbilicalis]|uniref:Myb-like domain-containing protein n=1 Tax=Porphyra umbilicalis TaxID=2786 RepID=A0A1X6NUL3_PORUM|nr:hypothetical protein BU14_0459s0021 [Porphyra umbilicalis]|eukprot:OSX72200.1 hypothetical protein BU14_0459s0021 [Porphyra umbilicalis]